MNNQFSVIIKRYLIAVLIAILGLVMIIIGLQTEQDALFNIAAVNLFIGGILVLLFSAGILNRKIVFIIGILCIGITVYIGVQSYYSVKDTITHMEQRKDSEKLVRYTLTQVRDIQRAHKDKYGVYAGDWNELLDFFKNDSVVTIEAAGSVPTRTITIKERDELYDDNRAIDRNMTEREAALLVEMGNPDNRQDLQGFVRDTLLVPYKDEYMSSITRIKERNSLGLGKFSVEELKYIPMTDPKEEWTIETNDRLSYLGDT
ncbi:MAG: hypothetical protein WED10_04235, partial [Brumimicrobium sp.]